MNEMIILKQIVFSLLLVIPTMSNSYAQNNSNIKTDDVSIVKMENYGCSQKQECCSKINLSKSENDGVNAVETAEKKTGKKIIEVMSVESSKVTGEEKYHCWDLVSDQPGLCPKCDEKSKNIKIERSQLEK